jgi:hypothetical protein
LVGSLVSCANDELRRSPAAKAKDDITMAEDTIKKAVVVVFI